MIATDLVYTPIKKQLGSFFSTDAHSPNDFIRYINSAVEYCVDERAFGFNEYTYSFTTTSIDAEYNIPYQIATFYILDSEGTQVEILNFRDYYIDSNKEDKICIKGDKLITELKGTFTIYYVGYPPIITTLTGNIDVPERFFDMIVLGGLYYGLLDAKMFQEAGLKKQILDGMVKSKAKRLSDKLPMQIKRMNTSKSNIW